MSTIFQPCPDNFLSSWVEPILSHGQMGLAKGNNTVTRVSLKLATLQSQV